MLQRLIRGNSDNIKIIYKILLIIIICLITVASLFSVASFAVSSFDFSYDMLPAVIAAILGVSSAFDGFVISKLSKENGLFWGLFAGLIIFILLFSISLYLNSFNITSNFFTKLAITVIAGAIGGIIGVNTN